MKKLTILMISVFAIGLAACGDAGDSNEPDQPTITKAEAAAMGGKSDHGIDWCEWLDWYGDGICDDFCVKPDPDCAETCDDGTQLSQFCDIREVCEAGLVSVVQNGCFTCVDPDTCQPPMPVDQMCGGIAGFQCPAGMHCRMDAGMCNVADNAGVCVPDFDSCTLEYNPVCGCDGQTYGNACQADAAGASVDHEGECLPLPPAGDCGGFIGLQCADGQFCNYSIDAMCGAADQMGTCETKPEACIALFDPVCGCDGNTYSNSCQAAAAGVSVVSEGSCN